MNAPKLRFKEFKEDWRNKLLEELADVRTGDKDTQNRVENGIYPFFVRSQTVERINSYSHDGEAVLTSGDGVGVGKNFHYIDGKFDYHQRVYCISNFKNTVFGKYVFFYFSEKFNKRVMGLSAKNSVDSVRRSMITEMPIKIPSLTEQTKIANFLTAVDEKITQLTQKHDLLTQYKKGVMQQIFSQELRFKDDDGRDFPEWKEVFLGDVASFIKGKGISKADIDDEGITPCIRYGELYTEYGETIREVKSKTNIDIKNLVLSEANDVIIPASGETQIDIATASCVQLSGVALGGDLNIIKSQENGVFLSYYLNNQKKLDIAKLAQGNSVVHLYSSQLKKLNIKLPIKLEQTKIADFLTAIDDKVTQIQAELDAVKQYKQGLLQQMFI